MKRLLTSLPVWLILADMVYGFALNVIQSFNLSREPLPKDGLPVSPDIAFSGLQVLANGGMILIIGFGLLVLLQLNRTVLQQQILPIGVLRIAMGMGLGAAGFGRRQAHGVGRQYPLSVGGAVPAVGGAFVCVAACRLVSAAQAGIGRRSFIIIRRKAANRAAFPISNRPKPL